MAEKKLIPDMSTPEGIGAAFEHLREHVAVEVDKEHLPKPNESDEPDDAANDLRRVVDLELLRILEEAGVEGADAVREELGRTRAGTGEALYGHVGEIGEVYAEQADEVLDDPLEQAKLSRIGSIAYAVGDIASAAILVAEDNEPEAREILDVREEIIEGMGEDEESLLAKISLEELIGNMRSVLPTTED
ncbi:MAG TPA: hypothetical protein VFW77_03510 [Candidatus Saccharimonadales bacterium]|nr:hypothetical protein [Candidatus Saccharimonadales bacterium]